MFGLKKIIRSVVLLISVLSLQPLSAQKISDPALKPYVELWQNENADSLRSVLPALLKKYPAQPEVLFFQSVFETDAEKAITGYSAIIKNYPDNALADESLYRLVQYDYAKGSYKAAQEKAAQLKLTYPASRFTGKADVMFAGLNQTTQIPVEALTSGADSAASQKISEKKFRLQVGAFGQIKNAEDLRERLKKNGYTQIEFSEKIVNDKKLFLVWVGAFDNKDEAAKTGEILKSKLQLSYTIVEK